MRGNLIKVLSLVKYLLLVLLLIFIVGLMQGDKISSASIEDVTEKVTKATDMTDLSAADNRTVRRLYGLNVNDYEGVSLYVSDSNMKVEEVLIVKLKDVAQADAVESAVTVSYTHLGHNIDSPFITQLEQRNPTIRFQRIDADVNEDIREEVA